MSLDQRAAIHSVLNDAHERCENGPKVGRWDMRVLGEIEREGELERLLRCETALSEFCGGFMRSDGTGSSILSMTTLIAWMIRRTCSVGAKQTLLDLERYLDSPTFPYRFLVGLRGVAVKETCELSDGIFLFPSCADINRFDTNPPATSAVLECKDALPKVIQRAGNFSSTPDAASRVVQSTFDRLNLARVCIALALDGPVAETTRTAIPEGSVPPTGGTGASAAVGVMGIQIRSAGAEILTRIKEVHARFIGVPNTLRDRLGIAAHRWHGSLIRGATPDLFIDVGIGLECVYLSDGAGELKHRMMIRAARLLAATTADRIRVANVIDALYESRSQAVHTGRLTGKIRHNAARDIYELATLGQQLLRESILAMIERGRDNWEEVIFG